MHVSSVAVRSKSRVSLVFSSAACLILSAGCHQKDGNPPPVPAAESSLDSLSRNGMENAPTPPDSAEAAPAEAPAAPVPLEFATRPPAKAYPGKPYLYRPVLTRAGPFKLRIVKGPDSAMNAAMKVEKGQVSWTPRQPGSYEVLLEATLASTHGGETTAAARQAFTLKVEPVLRLSLKPLPSQIGKGDTLSFDLRASAFPAWATSMLRVRFDYEGDGKWDTDPLPLADNLLHSHRYAGVGRFAPRVEAHFQDLEVRTAEGKVAVVSSVTSIFKITPDTVEPGGAVTVDASESKADGRLRFSLDWDGDGKPEWTDSASGKAVLKAPASGIYQAVLSARNPMGQEGKASAILRVNARTRLDFKVKNPRENMAAAVELKARAKDADDSLVRVRVNFTGDADGWQVRETPPDSAASPREWWFRFRHVYGKTGKYTASVCVLPADGREVCRTSAVEIFNAPPECRPGADLRATLGQPLEIDGGGVDPDGKIVKWEWDLDGDGKYDLISAANGKFQYTFSKVGVFPLVLRVTTADGVTATGGRKVEVRKKWKS